MFNSINLIEVSFKIQVLGHMIFILHIHFNKNIKPQDGGFVISCIAHIKTKHLAIKSFHEIHIYQSKQLSILIKIISLKVMNHVEFTKILNLRNKLFNSCVTDLFNFNQYDNLSLLFSFFLDQPGSITYDCPKKLQ